MKIFQDKLSNGIRVVTAVREDSDAVAFHIFFGCGGRHERDDVVGVSHALEHMVFKGTPTRSTLEIARQMEGNGATINAYTSAERTCYHFTAPVEVFGKVLEVYADAVNNCLLDKDEWQRERQVILEELKMYEDMPRMWVSDMLETTMFNLQMGVIGNRETINAIDSKDMRDLIDKWYVPGNTVISVAGGVSRKEVVEFSERFFGERKGSTRKTRAPELPSKSKQMVIDQARQTDQVNLAIGFRAFGMENEDAAALRLLGDILGGKMSSRLFTEVREKRGLAYSVSASPQTYTDSGYVALRAGVALEKAKEATKVILAEAARMKTELVDEEELSEGKRHLRGNLLVHESSSYFAGRNGSNLLLREKLFPVDEELAKIEAVTAEDVKRVAGDVFREEEMTLAVIAERALGAKLEPVLRI